MPDTRARPVSGADSPLTVHGESLPLKRTVQSVHRVSLGLEPSAVSKATDPEGAGVVAAAAVINRKATPNRSFGTIRRVYIRSSLSPLIGKSAAGNSLLSARRHRSGTVAPYRCFLSFCHSVS